MLYNANPYLTSFGRFSVNRLPSAAFDRLGCALVIGQLTAIA
jgi:hypothetical protein